MTRTFGHLPAPLNHDDDITAPLGREYEGEQAASLEQPRQPAQGLPRRGGADGWGEPKPTRDTFRPGNRQP